MGILSRVHHAQCEFPRHTRLVDWIVTLMSVDAAAMDVDAAACRRRATTLSLLPPPRLFHEFLRCFARRSRDGGVEGEEQLGAADAREDARLAFLVECLAAILERACGGAREDEDGAAQGGGGGGVVRAVVHNDAALEALYHGVASENAAFKGAARQAFRCLFHPSSSSPTTSVEAAAAAATDRPTGSGGVPLPLALVPHYMQGCLDCFPGAAARAVCRATVQQPPARHADTHMVVVVVMVAPTARALLRLSTVHGVRAGEQCGGRPADA
jgi:hypothetical protein